MKIIVNFLSGVIGTLMLSSLALLFINVMLREVVNFSIIGVENLTIYLIIWIVFLGTGLVFWKDEHISMDFLYELLSPNLRRLMNIITDLLVFITSIFLVVYGSIVTYQLYTLNQVSSDGMVPLYLVMISIPIGTAVCLLAILYKYISKLKRK